MAYSSNKLQWTLDEIMRRNQQQIGSTGRGLTDPQIAAGISGALEAEYNASLERGKEERIAKQQQQQLTQQQERINNEKDLVARQERSGGIANLVKLGVEAPSMIGKVNSLGKTMGIWGEKPLEVAKGPTDLPSAGNPLGSATVNTQAQPSMATIEPTAMIQKSSMSPAADPFSAANIQGTPTMEATQSPLALDAGSASAVDGSTLSSTAASASEAGGAASSGAAAGTAAAGAEAGASTGSVAAGAGGAATLAGPAGAGYAAGNMGASLMQSTDLMGKNEAGYVGGIAGGASAGAAVGSMFGGIGAIPGAILGGIAGGVSQLIKNESIVCSELKSQGYLDEMTWAADTLTGNRIKYSVRRGYIKLFSPVVKGMKKSTLVSMAIRPIGLACAKELASWSGHGSGSKLGRVILKIGMPICGLFGRI